MLRKLFTFTALAVSLTRSALVAQTIPVGQIARTQTVTLKTFVPVDSFFVNPTQSEFTVILNNSISGTATEYRVTVQPDFFFSDVIARRVRIVFAG
jgi:hypothetical protein